jgi:hypothetical protein
VSRVLAEKPDVLFIGGASEPTALVAKQARELGFKGGFLIMDQAKLDEMAKVTGGLAPLEGSIGVLPVSYDDRAGPKAFAAAYRKAYGADKDPRHHRRPAGGDGGWRQGQAGELERSDEVTRIDCRAREPSKRAGHDPAFFRSPGVSMAAGPGAPTAVRQRNDYSRPGSDILARGKLRPSMPHALPHASPPLNTAGFAWQAPRFCSPTGSPQPSFS